MEKKYSAGPWELEQAERTEEKAVWYIQGSEENSTIVPLIAEVVFQDTDFTDIGEVEANARLIAAAPELLDSLQKAVEYFQMFNVQGRLGEEYNNMLAAISKAIGE